MRAELRSTLVAVAIAVLALGQTLPTLRGTRLDGRAITVPDSTRGAVSVLLLGFTYESRHDVEAWAARLRPGLAGGDAALYEVPVIGGLGRLASPFIESGMRKGTPSALRGRVFTVYSDVAAWKSRVGYDAGLAPDAAYVLIVDRSGRLVGRARGPFVETAARDVAARAREVAAGR